MTDVSIVITAYNSSGLLGECIGSIVNSIRAHSFELIVVDDASSDNSAEVASRAYDRVVIIKNPTNLGYVRSNNIGMTRAVGRYVLSLNNDTVVLPGSVDSLVNFMDSRPDAGAAGPKLKNSDGTIQFQCRRSFPDPVNSFFYFSGLGRLFPNSRFNTYLMRHIDDSAVQEVDCLCGAAMIVRREALDRVGLMDESYVMYGDDIDWCYRIKNSGFKIYYIPSAEIIHLGGMGGSKRHSFRNIYEFHRAMAVFYSKYYSGRYPFFVNWLVYSGIWLKCSAALVMNVFRKNKFVGTKKP